MSSYNDAWFMNESLAFYMSTNTFTNPIFDAMIEPSPNQLIEPTTNNGSNDEAMNNNSIGVQALGWKAPRKFCDSLAFSFRSKMYVLELDLKRVMRGLRKFADKRMPWLCRHSAHYRTTTTTTTTTTATKTSGNNLRFPSTSPSSQVNWLSGGAGGKDKFWLNYVEPNSRETLGLQKEKILNRLEQAIEEKRQFEQQQQLFNMNDGLPFVRYPKVASSQTSGSLSSSSMSSSNSGSCSGKFKNGKSTNKRSKSRWNSSNNGQQINHQQSVVDDDGDDERATDSAGIKKLCVVCYTNLPNIVTLPCKHDEICSDCFIELIYVAVKHSRYPLKCVLCRQKIERIRCSRSLLLSVIKKNRITP